jgi:hypothetical protein
VERNEICKQLRQADIKYKMLFEDNSQPLQSLFQKHHYEEPYQIALRKESTDLALIKESEQKRASEKAKAKQHQLVTS